eukprot:scaffold147339_cov35-Prasinocladus_malaysianus.AAC.4
MTGQCQTWKAAAASEEHPEILTLLSLALEEKCAKYADLTLTMKPFRTLTPSRRNVKSGLPGLTRPKLTIQQKGTRHASAAAGQQQKILFSKLLLWLGTDGQYAAQARRSEASSISRLMPLGTAT